ncbi:MAG: hypothetical protein AAGA62_02050 [Bacteroidota bacterium]
MSKYLLSFCLIFLLGSCTTKLAEAAAKSGDVKTVAYDQVAELAPGQSLRIEKNEASFTFLRVVSDSRCPKGVTCVRAGEAIVQLQRGTATPEEVIIEVDAKNMIKLPIEGGNVNILGLDPYPAAPVVTTPDAYRLRVVVKAP